MMYFYGEKVSVAHLSQGVDLEVWGHGQPHLLPPDMRVDHPPNNCVPALQLPLLLPLAQCQVRGDAQDVQELQGAAVVIYHPLDVTDDTEHSKTFASQ